MRVRGNPAMQYSQIKTKEELIKWLDEVFPHQCPTDTDVTEKEIWFYAGKRSLIDYLLNIEKAKKEDEKYYGKSN